MFGITNKTFTGFRFVGSIKKNSIEFAAGFVEEITFNVTANAAEIPDDFDLSFISENNVVKTTSVALTSKIAGANVAKIIAGATPNLFI